MDWGGSLAEVGGVIRGIGRSALGHSKNFAQDQQSMLGLIQVPTFSMRDLQKILASP
jgi:hypothetical protein